MRIAFILQTYRLLNQVGRLIDAINHGCPDNLIVITHSGSQQSAADIARGRRVSQVLPAVPGRGRFGLIDNYISALRWLLRQKVPYQWIVLLSGQDYPIRPLQEFLETMERSPIDGYFYYFDPFDRLTPPNRPFGWPIWSFTETEDRYYFRYSFLKDELSLAQRAALRLPRQALGLTRDYRLNTSYGLCFGIRAQNAPFSPDLKLYCGSYWHIIRKECGDAFLEFLDDNPRIVDYFRHVVLPDESLIHTVLVNNHKYRFSSDGLRFFNLTNSRRGHWKTLGPQDLDAAFKSHCYFARKFDMELHPEVFDILDARVCARIS